MPPISAPKARSVTKSHGWRRHTTPPVFPTSLPWKKMTKLRQQKQWATPVPSLPPRMITRAQFKTGTPQQKKRTGICCSSSPMTSTLFPGWDESLASLCRSLDPLLVDFAVKIKDSPNHADTTLRHPIVSRKFFESFGLFDPNFRGVYCDNDITMRAYLLSQILDGRELSFRHSHPHFERDVEESISHKN